MKAADSLKQPQLHLLSQVTVTVIVPLILHTTITLGMVVITTTQDTDTTMVEATAMAILMVAIVVGQQLEGPWLGTYMFLVLFSQYWFVLDLSCLSCAAAVVLRPKDVASRKVLYNFKHQ